MYSAVTAAATAMRTNARPMIDDDEYDGEDGGGGEDEETLVDSAAV